MGLLETIEFVNLRVSPSTELQEFICGDPEITQFYKEDVMPHTKSLIDVAYVIETPERKVLGFYCVSNDRIDIKYEKIKYIVPYGKLY